jgi:hypothetical protein
MAQLRRQLEIVNQRLDMIYGAVTRLAEAQPSPTSTPPAAEQTQTAAASEMPFAPEMMMDPGAMLDSLRQFAVSMGLDVSQETVDRLKSQPPPTDEASHDPA